MKSPEELLKESLYKHLMKSLEEFRIEIQMKLLIEKPLMTSLEEILMKFL